MMASLQRWHERLLHVDQAGIKSMIDHEVVNGATLNSNEMPDASCSRYNMGKSHRNFIPNKLESRSSAVLYLYTQMLPDPLRPSLLEKHAEARTSRNIKVLRTDNGGEYLSNGFRAYLADHGIKHEFTVACTLQKNGVAERMSRTLMNHVRAIVNHKGAAMRF
eukprot:IDg19368t1